MKNKTRPLELIFVVLNFVALNFVALDDCTRHVPFAIEHSDGHQSDRKRFPPAFDSRRH